MERLFSLFFLQTKKSSNDANTNDVEKQMKYLSDWINGKMDLMTSTIVFREENLSLQELNSMIGEFTEKKAILEAQEQFVGGDSNRQFFGEVVTRFSNYENKIKTMLIFAQQMDTYNLELASATDWINNIVNEISGNTSDTDLDPTIMEDKCQMFEDDVIKRLHACHDNLMTFECVLTNSVLEGNISTSLQSVSDKYEHLRLRVADILRCRSLKDLEKIISRAEDFINFEFPQSYKEQLRKSIVNKDDCLIRITENENNVSLLDILKNTINEQMRLCLLPWPLIDFANHKDSSLLNQYSSADEFYVRYSTVRDTLSDIYKLLSKWMEILEDLKMKWKELNLNQVEFQKWLSEIQLRNDFYSNESVHLDKESLLEQIRHLQNLKDEIENNSTRLITMMIKDDLVSTVTLSPEINDGNDLIHTETVTDKINAKYLYLQENVIGQMECWRDLLDKFDIFNKSSEDFKEDFNNLKERVEQLELYSKTSTDQLHCLNDIECTFDRIDAKYGHYHGCAGTLSSSLSENDQLMLLADAKRWMEEIVQLKCLISNRRLSLLETIQNLTKLNDSIHFVLSNIQAKRILLKNYILLPLASSDVATKMCQFKDEISQIEQEGEHINDLNHNSCECDPLEDDTKRLFRDLSHLNDMYNELKSEVKQIASHLEQVLELRKFTELIIEELMDPINGLMSDPSAWSMPEDTEVSLTLKIRHLQDHIERLDHDKEKLDQLTNSLPDSQLTMNIADMEMLDKSVQNLQLRYEYLSNKTSQELSKVQEALALHHRLSAEEERIKLSLNSIQELCGQEPSSKINSIDLLRSEEEIEILNLVLNEFSNEIQDNSKFLSEEASVCMLETVSGLQNDLKIRSDLISQLIEKIKAEKQCPEELSGFENHLRQLSDKLKNLHRPLPIIYEDSKLRENECNTLIAEIEFFERLLDKYEHEHDPNLSQMELHLKLIKYQVNAVSSDIVKRIEDRRIYYLTKGEVEGHIAQFKNHLDTIETPGVSLAARKDRYQSISGTMVHVNNAFRKLCALVPYINDNSTDLDKTALSDELHNIRSRISELEQHVINADLQTRSNISGRENLCSMIEKTLEKLESLVHEVSTAETVGLEINDVDQRISYYQLMKNQFVELVEQSDEWIDAIDDDYKNSEEIIDLDTKDKLDSYLELKEKFRAYHPKKIAALYNARETRIKLANAKEQINNWISAAKELRNKFGHSRSMSAPECNSNFNIDTLQQDRHSFNSIFEGYLCSCENALLEMKAICDTLTPFLSPNDAEKLVNDFNTMEATSKELLAFSTKSMEQLESLDKLMSMFKIDCETFDDDCYKITDYVQNMRSSLCENLQNVDRCILLDNREALEHTTLYLKTNLRPRLEKMFTISQQIYNICDSFSSQIVFEEYQSRQSTLEELEATCCHYRAVNNDKINFLETEDILHGRITDALTSATRLIIPDELIYSSRDVVLISNIKDMKATQEQLTELEEMLALSPSTTIDLTLSGSEINTTNHKSILNNSNMFSNIESTNNSLNQCLVKCQDEEEFRCRIQLASNDIIKTIQQLEDFLEHTPAQGAMNDLRNITTQINEIQIEINNRYTSHEHSLKHLITDLMSKYNNLKNNYEIVFGVIESDILVNEIDSICSESSVPVNASDPGVSSSSQMVALTDWLYNADKILSDKKLSTIDDLLFRMQQCQFLLRENMKENLDFLLSNGGDEMALEIVDKYREKSGLVNNLLNNLASYYSKYNTYTSVAHDVSHWLNDCIPSEMQDQLIEKKHKLELMINDTYANIGIETAPELMTAVLSQIDHKIGKLRDQDGIADTPFAMDSKSEDNERISSALQSFDMFLAERQNSNSRLSITDRSDIPYKRRKTNEQIDEFLISPDIDHRSEGKVISRSDLASPTSDTESLCIDSNDNSDDNLKIDEEIASRGGDDTVFCTPLCDSKLQNDETTEPIKPEDDSNNSALFNTTDLNGKDEYSNAVPPRNSREDDTEETVEFLKSNDELSEYSIKSNPITESGYFTMTHLSDVPSNILEDLRTCDITTNIESVQMEKKDTHVDAALVDLNTDVIKNKLDSNVPGNEVIDIEIQILNNSHDLESTPFADEMTEMTNIALAKSRDLNGSGNENLILKDKNKDEEEINEECIVIDPRKISNKEKEIDSNDCNSNNIMATALDMPYKDDDNPLIEMEDYPTNKGQRYDNEIITDNLDKREVDVSPGFKDGSTGKYDNDNENTGLSLLQKQIKSGYDTNEECGDDFMESHEQTVELPKSHSLGDGIDCVSLAENEPDVDIYVESMADNVNVSVENKVFSNEDLENIFPLVLDVNTDLLNKQLRDKDIINEILASPNYLLLEEISGEIEEIVNMSANMSIVTEQNYFHEAKCFDMNCEKSCVAHKVDKKNIESEFKLDDIIQYTGDQQDGLDIVDYETFGGTNNNAVCEEDTFEYDTLSNRLKSSFSSSRKQFKILNIPLNIANTVMINQVPLLEIAEGYLCQLSSGDVINVEGVDIEVMEGQPCLFRIVESNNSRELHEVQCSRRNISCDEQSSICINDEHILIKEGQELIVAYPGEKVTVNEESCCLGDGEYCWLDVNCGNTQHQMIFQDQVMPVYIDGNKVPLTEETYTYYTPLTVENNLDEMEIDDEIVKKVTVVTVDSFQWRRYTTRVFPVGSCISTEKGSSILQLNDVMFIRNVPSYTVNDDAPCPLLPGQCVILICDDCKNIDQSIACDKKLATNFSQSPESISVEVMPNRLKQSNDSKPIVISKESIDRAIDVISMSVNIPKNAHRFIDCSDIPISVNSLQQWIKDGNIELSNNLLPDPHDSMDLLKIKQNRLEDLESETKNRMTKHDILELKLEQLCNVLDENESKELQLQHSNLISGAYSLATLVQDTLEKVQEQIRIVEKDAIQKVIPAVEDPLLPSLCEMIDRKSSSGLSKKLSYHIMDCKDALEQLINTAEDDLKYLTTSDSNYFGSEQNQRILWQMLLTQCKTRMVQVKDACRHRVSKSLSPSFMSWRVHTPGRQMSLATIREEIDETIRACANNDNKCEENIYNMIKTIEDATQWIENIIISKVLEPANSEIGVNELTRSLHDEIKLAKDNEVIISRLSSKNQEIYKSVLENLAERISIVEQSQFTDAEIQTNDNLNAIKIRLDKSIQTFKNDEIRRVSFVDSVNIKEEIGCYLTDYCKTLSELVSRSCELGSLDTVAFDLTTLNDLDNEMHAMSLKLDHLSLELNETLESNCQYEKLLNNYDQFLSTGNNKLNGNYILIKDIEDMKYTIDQFKDFFGNFHIYRECLEDLRLKVSHDVADQLNDRHLDIIKRSDILEERANRKLLELLKLLNEWLDFDINFKELTNCLEHSRVTFDNIFTDASLTKSEENVKILESINKELQLNAAKVEYIIYKGDYIVTEVSSSNLKTDIEEFKEKWYDISNTVMARLDTEKHILQWSKSFEQHYQELDDHMTAIKDIIVEFHDLMDNEKTGVNFQQVVDRQSSIYHLKEQFYCQESLKSKVLQIGDDLMKSKRFDTTMLNRRLCSLETQWDGVCEDIRDAEAKSLSPLFALDTNDIPKEDILLLYDSINISLQKLKKEDIVLQASNHDKFVDVVRSVQLKLATIQPLIDLYCERNIGQDSDTISSNMMKINKDLNEEFTRKQVFSVQLKNIEELLTKVDKWTTSRSHQYQELLNQLHSKMDVKLVIMKLKIFEEEAKQQKDYLKQVEDIKTGLTVNQVLSKSDGFISRWLHSTEQNLTSERDKHRKFCQFAESLLIQFCDLESYKFNIMESQIELDHFHCQSNSLVIRTLSDVKSHARSLDVLNNKILGEFGCYTFYENKLKLIQEELQTRGSCAAIIVSNASISDRVQLSNKIRTFRRQLTGLIAIWENYDDHLKSINEKMTKIEKTINESFKADVLNEIQGLTLVVEKLDEMINDSRVSVDLLSDDSKRLMNCIDEISVRKIWNTSTLLCHRLYRVEKYRNILALKLTLFKEDHHFFTLHCQRMENMNNNVSHSLDSLTSTTVMYEDIEGNLCDLLKDVIRSRRNIDEIKSISYRFRIDNERKKSFDVIVAKRGELIHRICQVIQTSEIERTNKMDFIDLCKYLMTFIGFLEPFLQFGDMFHFEDVIEQQITFEFLQHLLKPKESIILILMEKGNRTNTPLAHGGCSHFPDNLNKLKLQWDNIVKQIQNGKLSFDKNVCTVYDFEGQIERFDLWSDNFLNRLVDFESEVCSVDEMNRLRFRLSILKKEKDVYETVFNSCLKVGQIIFDNAIDRDTRDKTDCALRHISDKWSILTQSITGNDDKLENKLSIWRNVDDTMEQLFAWIKEMGDFTTCDVPYYERLDLNLQKAQNFMDDLKASEPIRQELRANVNDLSINLSPDDVTIIYNREYLIEKQCQELAIQVNIRQRDICDRMSVWPQFISDWKSAMSGIGEIMNRIDTEDEYKIMEMIQTLENDIIPNISTYEQLVNDIRMRGLKIQDNCDENRSSDIKYRLGKLNDAWTSANQSAISRLGELKEIFNSIDSFEEKSHILKQWMVDMKVYLKNAIILERFQMEIPRQLVKDCEEKSLSVESHEKDVSAIVFLCEILIHNPDACPTNLAKEEVIKTRQKLKNRWQNIKLLLSNRQNKLHGINHSWQTMELKISDTNTFINEMDQRLQSLVRSLEDESNDSLDKLEIMKTDIDLYEYQIRDFIELFDSMSQQDQLDKNNEIESSVKNLKTRFDTIQHDLSVMIKRMKIMLNVTMELNYSCNDIEKRVKDIEKEIEGASPDAPWLDDLRNIKYQFVEQLEILRQLNVDNRDLRGALNTDSTRLPCIIDQIKQSKCILGSLSLEYGEIIRSVSLQSDVERLSQDNSLVKGNPVDQESIIDNRPLTRRAKGLVRDLNVHIDASNQFLSWVDGLLQHPTVDISSVILEDSNDGNKTMKSFAELVRKCRYKIKIIKSLDEEIRHLMEQDQMTTLEGFCDEAANEIEKRWEKTFNDASEIDMYNTTKHEVPIYTSETSKDTEFGSRKGSSDNRKSSIGSQRSSRSSRHHKVLVSVEEGLKDQLIPLKEWIRVASIQVRKGQERTEPKNLYKLNIRQIKSELEDLSDFFEGFPQWSAVYNDNVGSRQTQELMYSSISQSWDQMIKLAESWINHVQNMVLKSVETENELKALPKQLNDMYRHSQNLTKLTDSFLYSFDQVKNDHSYWKRQLIPISKRATHHLKMDFKVTGAVTNILEQLLQLDNVVHLLSLAIINSESQYESVSEIKSVEMTVDDGETSAPIPTSSSLSNDEDNINDSSRMIPSISSFEQPYIAPRSDSEYQPDNDNSSRLRVSVKLPRNIDNDNYQLAQGDYPTAHSMPTQHHLTNSNRRNRTSCCFLIFLLIAVIIVVILVIIALFQPYCENGWECTAPLSSLTLKKSWSKSAAI